MTKTPNHSGSDLPGSQSVDRALKLLGLVSRHAEHGASLSAIVDESGINKPTSRRLLMALMRAGLVEQDPGSRRYFLGEEAYVLGTLASQRYGLLELSTESLRNLASVSADTTFLTVRRENYSMCLHRQEGAFPVRTHALQVGDQHPLGVGAGALAILAALPDLEIEHVLGETEKILAMKYPSYSRDQILADVAETRANGISLNPGRLIASSWAIGATIRYPDGRVAGALSIAAIDSRLRKERVRELGPVLTSECERVEAKLGKMFSPGQRKAAAPRPVRRNERLPTP